MPSAPSSCCGAHSTWRGVSGRRRRSARKEPNMRKGESSELTHAQRRSIVLAGIVQLALLAAALFDIRRRPSQEINGSKLLWTGLAFVNFIGPLAYFLFGRKR